MDVKLIAQALALLVTLATSIASVALHLPVALFAIFSRAARRALLPWSRPVHITAAERGALFYEGTVFHTRRSPQENTFT